MENENPGSGSRAGDGKVLLPPGQYRCRVKAASEGKTRKGQDRWSLLLEVMEGPHLGATIRDDLYWSKKAVPRVKLFLKALGESPKGEKEFNVSVVRGRELLVNAEIEERDGL